MLIESIGLRVRAYATPRQFLDELHPDMVGCLVLDIRMPQMSGLSVQMLLAERKLNIPIIFITGHGDIAMAVSAMKEGAVDFIEKPIRQQSLIDSIQVAIRRHIEVRQSQLENERVESRLAKLSARELEILDLILCGMSNKAIARELDLSARTVEVHRANIFAKVEVGSLAELIRSFSASRAKDKNSDIPAALS